MNELLSTISDIASIGSFLVTIWIGSNVVKIRSDIKIETYNHSNENQNANTFFGNTSQDKTTFNQK